MHVIKEHYWQTTQNVAYRCQAGLVIAAGDADIVMLEDCTGMTKHEMLLRENHYQKTTAFCVNLNHARYEKHRCAACNCEIHNKARHERSARHKRATT
jgi:hypothetical protein